MHALPSLNRVPGPAFPTKSDKQSYRKDLTKITKAELLEILEREETLLKNKVKLAKLPDKGQKIIDYHEKVVAELKKRDEIELAAEKFSRLNIASVGKRAMDNLEWTGSASEGARDEVVDSDDDEDDVDPLKIIAGSNEVNKIVKIEKPETLITEEDLKDIEQLQEKSTGEVVEAGISSKKRISKLIGKMEVKAIEDENQMNKVAVLLEPHALHLCERELTSKPSPKAKFLPSRTTLTDVHNPEREMQRRVARNWEATAATPPILRHSGVKALSLQESIEAQKENYEKVKRMQEEQAKERLKLSEIRMRDRAVVSSLRNDAVNFSDYREREESESEEEIDSEDEVHDEEVERGGVVYTVEG